MGLPYFWSTTGAREVKFEGSQFDNKVWDNLLGHSIIINHNPLGRKEIINETID